MKSPLFVERGFQGYNDLYYKGIVVIGWSRKLKPGSNVAFISGSPQGVREESNVSDIALSNITLSMEGSE